MKKQFLTLIFLVSLSSGLFAQSPSVERFFDSYDGMEGLTVMEIKGNFLQMMVDDEDLGEDDQFRGLRLIASKDDNRGRISSSDVSSLLRDMKREGFEEMMSLRDGNSKVNIFGKKKNSKRASDLTLVVNEGDKFVLISLWGDFDFKKASRFLKDVNVNGNHH